MSSARVPAASPLVKALKNSKMPPAIAHIPAISTRTSAVGTGQASATTPTMSASTPRRIREVAGDLNMGHVPF